MFIRHKRLNELLKKAYERGYNQGFQMGELHAMKGILRWRRLLESEPMDAVAREIEEILRRKGGRLMPECPICGEYFMDQDKLSVHIYAEHPEKVSTPDSMAKALAAASEEQSLRSIATALTETSLRHNISKDDVVQRWWQILLRLRGVVISEKYGWHDEKTNG